MSSLLVNSGANPTTAPLTSTNQICQPIQPEALEVNHHFDPVAYLKRSHMLLCLENVTKHSHANAPSLIHEDRDLGSGSLDPMNVKDSKTAERERETVVTEYSRLCSQVP